MRYVIYGIYGEKPQVSRLLSCKRSYRFNPSFLRTLLVLAVASNLKSNQQVVFNRRLTTELQSRSRTESHVGVSFFSKWFLSLDMVPASSLARHEIALENVLIFIRFTLYSNIKDKIFTLPIIPMPRSSQFNDSIVKTPQYFLFHIPF